MTDSEQRQTIAEPPRTQWYEAEIRPLVAADDGMIVVGKTDGQWFVGQLTASGDVIEPLPGSSGVQIAASSVVVYTLLDPPVPFR